MLAETTPAQPGGAAADAPARWLALVGAVEQLARAETLDAVIAIVRATARTISGADGVTFVLRDEDNCHYVAEDAVGPLWTGKRFPLTACISGWCMLHDTSAVIPDIYVDARIPHDAYRPTFVKSLVMVPVKTDKAVAAIGSYWASQRTFDDSEVAIIEALARSASAAIASVQMRESLRESEDRLCMALKAGELGTWEMDLGSEIFSASPLTKTSFGFAPDTVLTREAVRDAVHPDDLEAARLAFALAIRDNADIRVEVRSPRQDGTVRWIAIRGRAVLDGNGRPVRLSGVCGDVTYRREAKERMDRLQSDIAHIGRLTEMGEMVSAFAHELRQPLTAANNYLSAAKRFLAQSTPPTERINELIEKADGQFVRATQIIQRIRGFASKSGAEKTPEDIAALIGEAAELARLDPRHHGVGIRKDIARALSPVPVDKVQIQQVLLNLLRNAFEAMEGRETRAVTVCAQPGQGGGTVEVSVRDTGPGLSPEVADRLFQPFVTTKDSGMGVGLSICRTIIESHGGKMWAVSTPGKGAAFHFTLPVESA